MCLTSDNTEETKSTVAYMAPLNASINDNATVQQVLQISQQACREVGQSITLVTFDLAVAKKAYNIIWQQSEIYRDVFVHLGVFHTILSYLGAIGKLMRGSGFEDIVTESGICASGSMEGVLTGKHYNRAIRVHSVVMEALERLLFRSFTQRTEISKLVGDAKEAIKRLSPESGEYTDIMTSDSFIELASQYFIFKDQVRNGRYGKTAQFWIQYLDRIWLLLRFLRATKSNDLDLHISCLEQLCPLLFMMDHHNYARYVSYYLLSLKNLSNTKPEAEQLIRRGFSVSRSHIPNSRTPIDLTIEQTINRQAKTKGGIVGFSKNGPAYYRWCVTRHSRACYLDATLAMTGLTDNSSDGHKELSQAQKKQSEAFVQRTMEAVAAFINPFDTDGENLLCLSSGLQLPDDVATKLVHLEKDGKEACKMFAENRLQNKLKGFHDPLHRNNVTTFSSLKKVVSMNSNKNKIVKVVAQRDILGQLFLLSQKHNIDLVKVMSYPLNPVPWALATGDGLLMKTNKATLLHKMEDDEITVSQLPTLSDVHIIDGNALLQSLTALPQTFGELALKVFDSLPRSQVVHFVTDSYSEVSIKSTERIRRGSNAMNSYILQGPRTKIPQNWKTFLSNDNNKVALIDLLLREWEQDIYARKLLHRSIFFVCRDTCILLSSEDGVTTDSIPVHELSSSQEEADTKIILHCMHASKQPQCEKIIVRSPDTDVVLLLLAFSSEINKNLLFDTGTANNRRQLSISKRCDKTPTKLLQAFLGLHAFTGCDSTSSFVGKGKIRPLSIMKKDEVLLDIFAGLGMQEQIDDSTLKHLERFVCLMYGHTSSNDVNKVRATIVRQRFTPGDDRPMSHRRGLDLSQLPPCRNALVKHIKRANYQAMIWRQASQTRPDLPSPDENGWVQTDNGTLEIDWCDGQILPSEIVDILADSEFTQQEAMDDDEPCDVIEWLEDSEEDMSETDDEF